MGNVFLSGIITKNVWYIQLAIDKFFPQKPVMSHPLPEMPSRPNKARILVAGIGNILRGDDGFGIEVVRRLQRRPDLPQNVKVQEFGIAGIGLVQELLEGYDMLIIIDVIDGRGPAGTLYLLEPDTPETAEFLESGMTSDPHQTGPSNVLMLAKALNVLPSRVFIIGCQPADCDILKEELSPVVASVVDAAVEKVFALIRNTQQKASPGARSVF